MKHCKCGEPITGRGKYCSKWCEQEARTADKVEAYENRVEVYLSNDEQHGLTAPTIKKVQIKGD